jgi:hypothetical protein
MPQQTPFDSSETLLTNDEQRRIACTARLRGKDCMRRDDSCSVLEGATRRTVFRVPSAPTLLD